MKWSDFEIKEILLGDKLYPSELAKINDAPRKLFYRGEINSELFNKTIAIVGSRRETGYGRQVVSSFVADFVSNKITTISGFMYGVDTDVHKQTINCGGITIAVFGCGLNYVYPSENDNLYSQILESGGVVFSEYEANTKPKLWTYPQRNRIVSGLSTLGVLVVEAKKNSGSLITANIAKKQKKKIWLIPGPITSSSSEGTNDLIKAGVGKLVTDSSDILGGVVNTKGQENVYIDLDLFEQNICKILSSEELTIDELSVILNIEIVELSSKLSMMGLKGLVLEVNGKYRVLKKL